MFRFQDQCFVIYETRIGLFDRVTLSGSLLITGLKIIFILCFDVLLIWPIPVKRRNDFRDGPLEKLWGGGGEGNFRAAGIVFR